MIIYGYLFYLRRKTNIMKSKHYEFTEFEIVAIKEALTEYYQQVSKIVLKMEDIGDGAKVFHNTIKTLKEKFKADCY